MCFACPDITLLSLDAGFFKLCEDAEKENYGDDREKTDFVTADIF